MTAFSSTFQIDFASLSLPSAKPSCPPPMPVAHASRPPRPQVELADMRKTFVIALPQQKKASRRWVLDLCMIVVGLLVGTYAGSAPARAFAARAVHGHLRAAPVAVSAAATSTPAAVTPTDAPLTPDLNRTASGVVQATAPASVAVASTSKASATKSKGTARGRRPAVRASK